MQIHEVLTGPPHEGDTGQGLVFRTSRGDVPAILHQAPDSQQAAIYVCGAGGGFGGPAGGVYGRLGESLREKGITGMRLNYRQPNVFPECVLDLLAGVMFLQKTGYGPVALIGHSFGGAVVVAAGAASRHVCGVAALASQTYGANMAGLLSPKRLLVVHGKNDTRLPFSCGLQIYDWAQEPKQLVLYDGAEHRLQECGAELETLLGQWVPDTLNSAATQPEEGAATPE